MNEDDERRVRQITPATGWRALVVDDLVRLYDTTDPDQGTEVRELPIACFALFEPPYGEIIPSGAPDIIQAVFVDDGEFVFADDSFLMTVVRHGTGAT